MAQARINRMTNANVILNGESLLGQVEEASGPMLKMIMAEHKWLGGNGKVELPTGVDKMEMKLKWAAVYPDAMAVMFNPYSPLDLQIRGNLEQIENGGVAEEVAYVVYVRATSKDMPSGAFKQHDNVELESNLNCTYMKIEVDGREILEYDVFANIHRVDGVDIRANFRNNIGA